jgi:hypothetical protein
MPHLLPTISYTVVTSSVQTVFMVDFTPAL